MPGTNLSKTTKKSASPRKKAKRKKVQYRKMAFKLTKGQKEALERLCQNQRTTPVRFLKALVNKHVERYRKNGCPPSYVTENQLELFDDLEKE